MNIIVCVDDNYGMLFNKRRVSSDAVLCERIVKLVGDGSLFLNEYSAKLFEKFDVKLNISDDFIAKAGKSDYCFVEEFCLEDLPEKPEKIILYRWNRRYPSDKKFPIAKFENSWTKESAVDFEGKSHPEITEEIYLL